MMRDSANARNTQSSDVDSVRDAVALKERRDDAGQAVAFERKAINRGE